MDYLKILADFQNCCELHPGTTKMEIESFEQRNHVKLPEDLKELLMDFNGGELFIPGTVVFGIEGDRLRNENRKQIRKLFAIPTSYLIFAKANTGDYLCINLNTPYDVILWDHELDEALCDWPSIERWFADDVENYRRFAGDPT